VVTPHSFFWAFTGDLTKKKPNFASKRKTLEWEERIQIQSDSIVSIHLRKTSFANSS
jgi:hypothetical protein